MREEDDNDPTQNLSSKQQYQVRGRKTKYVKI